MAKSGKTVAIRLRRSDLWMLDQVLYQEEARDSVSWRDMQSLVQRNPDFEQRFMSTFLPTFRRNKIGELIRQRYLELAKCPRRCRTSVWNEARQ